MMNSFLDQPLKASQIFAPSPEDEGYVPLPLYHLSPGWEVPFQVYVKLRLRDNPVAQLVLCCERHHTFEHKWYKKLTDLGITTVYYPEVDEESVLQYLTHNLSNFLGDKKLSTQAKASRLGDVTIIWLRHFFREEKARTGQLLNLALGYLDDLLELVLTGGATSTFVLDLWRHDHDLYTHCLNICLVGLAFVSYLKWPRDQIQAFGIGCLLHDIGMTQVHRDILRKDGQLDEEEWGQIKKHPVAGFQMLKSFATLKREIMFMVQQHHENGDGSGYPQGLKMAGIHPWARLLRILDSYEAITAPRRWRPARQPKEALWVIKKDWQEKNIYDPTYLREFIKFLAAS